MPTRCALVWRNRIQHIERFGIIAVADIVVGRLHLGAFTAGVAAGFKAAEPERVKPEAEPERVLVGLLLPVVAACAALGAALVIALARPAAAFAHNLAVSSLNLLELVLGRRVVGVQIRVVLLALLAVGFFDGLLVGTGLDAQYAVRVGHCVPFLLGAGLGFLARVAFTSAYLLQTPA